MNLRLTEPGTRLHVRNGLLLVQRKDQADLSFSFEDIKRIYLSRRCTLSGEVLFTAVRHQIEVILADRRGKHYGSFYSEEYKDKGSLRKAQALFQHTESALNWVNELVGQKLLNQMLLLHAFANEKGVELDKLNNALSGIQRAYNRVQGLEGKNLMQRCASLRGMEGTGSVHYFKGLNALLPEFYRFEKRSQHPAVDPFNALLNYGYGILYGIIEADLLKAGLDPSMGVLHADSYGKPVLTFDIIELFRWWVDYPLIELARAELFDPGFFEFNEDSCTLDISARRVVAQSVHSFLSQTVEWRGLSRSRENHIQNYCHQFSEIILNA